MERIIMTPAKSCTGRRCALKGDECVEEGAVDGRDSVFSPENSRAVFSYGERYQLILTDSVWYEGADFLLSGLVSLEIHAGSFRIAAIFPSFGNMNVQNVRGKGLEMIGARDTN